MFRLPCAKNQNISKNERLIAVKTHYLDGQYIHDEHTWTQGLKSPAAIVNVKNGIFKTTVVNFTHEKKIIYNNEKFQLEPFENNETNVFRCELNSTEAVSNVDEILKKNLEKITTDHMNDEEKRKINKLCFQYRDLFYSEHIPLTFIHAVKHRLRISDDTSIFVRSYRQAPQQRQEIKNQVDNLFKQGIIRKAYPLGHVPYI